MGALIVPTMVTILWMSVFGGAYGQKITGEVLIHGKPADVSTIPRAMAAG